MFLPVLLFEGPYDVCMAWVTAQNVGTDPTTVVLVYWGEASASCPGPVDSECSGLIGPGASWNFLGSQIHNSGAVGGALYSFDPDAQSGFGVANPAADYLCERAHDAAVSSCSGIRAFHSSYTGDGTFEGMDLATMRGQPIVVSVMRNCPGDVSRGLTVSSMYSGFPFAAAESGPSLSEYEATVFPLDGAAAPARTFVYVQSMATDVNDIVVETSPLGSRSEWSHCANAVLNLGETALVDLSGCLAPDTWYAVRAVGTGPLAVVAERAVGDVLATWGGFGTGPVLDATGAPWSGDLWRLVAPLVPVGSDWSSRIAVRVPGEAPAEVTVTWIDAAGMVAARRDVRAICGGCTESFVLEPWDGVTSAAAVVAAGSPSGTAPRIDATVLAVNHSESDGGFGYSLARTGAAGRVLAVPNITNDPLGLGLEVGDLTGAGRTHHLHVANVLGGNEPAAVRVRAHVANDVIDVECLTVPPGTVANTWVSPRPAFTGTVPSGLIEAYAPDVVQIAIQTTVERSQGISRDADEWAVEVANAVGLAGLEEVECSSYTPPLRADPAPPAPAPSVRSAIRLPILGHQGHNDVCTDVIEVTNTGSAAAFAVVVLWAEQALCPPRCAGPFTVECSGLIAPSRGQWVFDRDALGPGSQSGIVYGTKALSMDEVGADPGNDEPAAQALCRALLAEVVGDCDDMRRFTAQWASGGSFADVPLALLAHPNLEVAVRRVCPGPSGSPVSYDYGGISADRFDPSVLHHGRWVQSVLPVSTGLSGETTLYIQNGGTRCTSVHVHYHRYGDWSDITSCNLLTLAPGETYPWEAADCVGRGWTGAVVLDSTEPLAVLGETLSPLVGLAAVGRNRSNPYDITGDNLVDESDLAALDRALGSTAADPSWNWLADLDADRAVTLLDRAILEDNLHPGVIPPPSPTPPTATTPTATAASTASATASSTVPATSAATETITATATKTSAGAVYLPLARTWRH